MNKRLYEYRRNVATNNVIAAYEEIVPLLAMGRVEDARTLLFEKYRIGPLSIFTKGRSVVVYWLEKMGDLQYSFIVEERAQRMSFFERQMIRSTHQSLGDLVKAFVLDADAPLIDATNRSLLHHAAFFQLTGVCEFLMAQRYDPNGEANGNETPAFEALTGFECLPLPYAEDSDPFRVKELFRALLNGGADPYFPSRSSKSAHARLKTLTKWWNCLRENDAAREKAAIPDFERKIELFKSCYLDPIEERRLRKLRGEL
ncbi:MAG: hypothetical protein ACI4NV_08745 [Thermoguttaceae bacterium]